MKRGKALLHALFGTSANVAISIVMLALFAYLAQIVWSWAVSGATFIAASRAERRPGGACWVFITGKLSFFLYGNFPAGSEWRVHLPLAIVLVSIAGAMLDTRHRARFVTALALSVPVNALLFSGGFAGLAYVRTSDWGGLMLNIMLAFVAVGLSIPLGIALAFARRSKKRRIAWAATLFVEFWRAVPLFAVLFMGVVMLPLFLRPGSASTISCAS